MQFILWGIATALGTEPGTWWALSNIWQMEEQAPRQMAWIHHGRRAQRKAGPSSCRHQGSLFREGGTELNPRKGKAGGWWEVVQRSFQNERRERQRQ